MARSTLTRDKHDAGFSSQAEAIKAAREALWGTVPFAQRAMLLPERGTYGIYVTALVNGRLIVIDFDNYGRTSTKPLVLA